MAENPPPRRALVIGAAVLAVLAAGAFAIAANVGLLDASDDHPVGQLAATQDLPSVATAAPTVPAGVAQPFVVTGAGSVTVTADGGALQLGTVQPEPGWAWTASQPGAGELVVEFTRPGGLMRFDAALSADGRVVATVTDGSAPPVAAAAGHDDEDDHESDDDHEYEGGDDDD